MQVLPTMDMSTISWRLIPAADDTSSAIPLRPSIIAPFNISRPFGLVMVKLMRDITSSPYTTCGFIMEPVVITVPFVRSQR